MKTIQLSACVALSLATCLRLCGIDLNGGSHQLAADEFSATFTNSSKEQATLTIDGGGTFSGSISGNIKLVKTGGGTLGVTTVNDFIGGLDLQGGVCNFTVRGSLGSGQIVIAGGATLQFNSADCDNPVHLMASSSKIQFAQNAVVNHWGAITGESGITFAPVIPQYAIYCRFRGDITIPNGTLKAPELQETQILFTGHVSVGTVNCINWNYGHSTGLWFSVDGNKWDKFSYSRYNAQSLAPLFWAGAIPKDSVISCQYVGSGDAQFTQFDFQGDQEFRYFTTETAGLTLYMNATDVGTVTLGSEVEWTGSQKTANYRLLGPMSLVYAPGGDYAWSINGGASTMTGTLTVRKGTLAIGGSATFQNVPKVTVASGAKFTCTSTAASPLKSLKSIDLEKGAAFELGEGIELQLDSYLMGGKLAVVPEGWYTGSDNPNPKAGDRQTVEMFKGKGRIYVPYQGDVSAATWVGAGVDTSVKTGENWESGFEPDWEGGLTATFAKDGSSATFFDAVGMKKIVFCRATGFTLEAGADAARVSLSEGLEATAPAAGGSVTNVIAVPVHLTGAQTWNAPANTLLELRAPISSEGPTPFALSGAGTFAYYGTNTFSGSVLLTNGAHRVYVRSGAFGAANPGSAVDFRSSLGASLYLGGTKIEKDFTLTKPTGNHQGGISFAAGTTNEFAGRFTLQTPNWTPAGGNSRIVFSGGGWLDGYFRPESGTYVYTGKPISIGVGYMLKSPHVFEVSSNSVTEVEMNESSDLWLKAPMAFKDRPPLVQNAASGENNNAVVHLDGNDQAFGNLTLNNAYGWFETPTNRPARLSFRQTASGTTLRPSAFRGPISLEIVGTGANAVTVNGPMETTGGELTVKDVRLSVGENGTFASVTNVVATGASTVLAVACRDPFARCAKLVLDGGAKVEVPAGVVMRVGTLYAGGKHLRGVITSEVQPEAVSGGGCIRTSDGPLVITLR